MPYIDLTHPVTHSMPTYPGDPIPSLVQTNTLETDGYVDHELRSTMHVGTHIDAPMHMIPGGKGISDMPIEHFFGRGVLIDVREKSVIDTDMLALSTLNKGDIVLFYTGRSADFGSTTYFDAFPDLTPAAAERLINAQVRMVGFDSPSPDHPPYPIHTLLLDKEILIIENLTNLEALVGISAFEVMALPMHMTADAAPARVVAHIR